MAPGADSPTGGSAVRPRPGGKQADATDHLTSGCANGNGPLTAKKLVEIDGSVGYSDISTARNNSPSLAINPGAASAPVTPYWTQVQNGSNVFTEPTAESERVPQRRCKRRQLQRNRIQKRARRPRSATGHPPAASTRTVGYGICTMTYGLVFDDNAAVWGDTPPRRRRPRRSRTTGRASSARAASSACPPRTTRRCRPTSSRSRKPASTESAGKVVRANGAKTGGGNSRSSARHRNDGVTTVPAKQRVLAAAQEIDLVQNRRRDPLGQIPVPGVLELVGTANVWRQKQRA